jgi:hypothetical protein
MTGAHRAASGTQHLGRFAGSRTVQEKARGHARVEGERTVHRQRLVLRGIEILRCEYGASPRRRLVERHVVDASTTGAECVGTQLHDASIGESLGEGLAGTRIALVVAECEHHEAAVGEIEPEIRVAESTVVHLRMA